MPNLNIYENTNFSEVNIKKIICYVCLFFFFLYPYSISLDQTSVSANYSFALFPVLLILISNKINLPDRKVFIFFLIFLFILISSIFSQTEYINFLDRKLISFILFSTIFLFSFIKIDKSMLISFKISVILISLFQILLSIYVYFEQGSTQLGFAAKGIVGNQRFAFIYLLALWLMFGMFFQSWFSRIIKLLVIIIILSGILLTFSRSAIISLLFVLIVYLFSFFSNKENYKFLLKDILKYFFYLCIILLVLSEFFPKTFEFYDYRLFSYFFEYDDNKTRLLTKLNEDYSSEGYRIYIVKKIFNFLKYNLFTGSGFLGVWVMSDDLVGSSHNQYTDILFRSGIIGFVIYLVILINIFKFLLNFDKNLAWGFLSILVYGLFHETFKLSHGAFVLSFFAGLTYQKNYLRLKKNNFRKN